MSDQPIRRVLFAGAPTSRGFQNTKTILKPKEELRSCNPVATPTSGTKKRRRVTSFESTPLKDICDASPVPLPIAAAAAAAAAAKRINGADGRTAVEEMMKAAGQVLNSHSMEEGEGGKQISTPVRRKSVTFAEPIQVGGDQQSLTGEGFNKAEQSERSGAAEESISNTMDSIPAMETDTIHRENVEKQNHVRPANLVVHRSTAPKDLRETENRRVGFQHAVGASDSLNGRDMELERMLLLNKKKRHLERSPFACNEEIKSQRDSSSNDEKVRTKYITFTKDEQLPGSGAFDSQPLEEEAENHTPASRHGSRWKPNRAQSKLELKLSNSFGTQIRSNEAGQRAFKEESARSSVSTESDSSELESRQRSWKRSHRKPRLSEVLKLQKALETAFWTDSRMVRQQTQAIVISDDESAVTLRGNNSSAPKEEAKVSVKKECDSARLTEVSDTIVSRSVTKHDKGHGIVKPAKSASVLQRRTAGSPSIASRTRSRTTGATAEKVPLSFQDRLKPKKKSDKKPSRAPEEIKNETTSAVTQVGKHDEEMVVRKPKISKRKRSVPKHIALDVADGAENLSPSPPKRGRINSEESTAASPRTFAEQRVSLNASEEEFDSDAERDREVSPENQGDPLRDLVKVKLSKKMWQSVEEGWAVHNDITSCTKPQVNSSVLGFYVESPFGCADLVSAFDSDFGLEDKDS